MHKCAAVVSRQFTINVNTISSHSSRKPRLRVVTELTVRDKQRDKIAHSKIYYTGTIKQFLFLTTANRRLAQRREYASFTEANSLLPISSLITTSLDVNFFSKGDAAVRS